LSRVDLRRAGRGVLAGAAAAFAALAYVYLTLPDVRPLRSTNPGSTAFMELRASEAGREGRRARRDWRWVPYGRIASPLRSAVVAAEDGAFWTHGGIDTSEIRASIRTNLARGRFPRGASTITQQLAKNLYLSPSRDPLRKLRELFIARRLEAELPKRRILEIYLNVIEWGDGVYGAEAAARRYFATSASALGTSQAALLAGAIVNPRVLNPARPSTGLRWRQRLILQRLRVPASRGPLRAEPPGNAPAIAPRDLVPLENEPLDPDALVGDPIDSVEPGEEESGVPPPDSK
jgi:monofunctional biosynthetic peptidoglycan transglycosylase